MEFEIVIRPLKVHYVDLENMGNGRKNVEHLPQRLKGESLIFF